MKSSGLGRVWRFGDNINTDLIQPGHALLGDVTQEGRYVFEANRPGWVDEMAPGDVIVGGRNFGTGSSRPAARALVRAGVGALIADSINSLFFRNCVNYGLPALQFPGISAQFAEGDIAGFDITTGQIRNVTAGSAFDADPWPADLLRIFEAGGLIPLLAQEDLVFADETAR